MIVQDIGIFPGDPYPERRLDVDGVRVILVPDQQKRAILDAGYVYLGPKFEGKLPPVHFPVDSHFQVLRGFTDNARVVDLFRDFLAQIA